MWDFSWLTRRDGDEAEYRDWPRVLDELVERGYDCVRIDAFPHLVTTGDDTATILPEPISAQWGNSSPVEVRPRQGLIEFLKLASQRDLRVGLSTWFNPDTTDQRSTVRTPQDYARVWGETLAVVHDAGLDGCIEWVDLCNEFPFGGWAHGAYPRIFGQSPRNPAPYFLPWRDGAVQRMQPYIDESIGALKARFPQHRYTLSFMGISKANFYKLDTTHMDLVEPHVWLTDHIPFSAASLGFMSMAQFPFGEALHARVGPSVYAMLKKHWLGRLGAHMDDLSSWAHERDLPLYTSEGWATVMYGGRPAAQSQAYWSWIKEICEAAAHMAVDRGWTGICTSNFAQPHFPGMWSDVAWHQRVTSAIRHP